MEKALRREAAGCLACPLSLVGFRKFCFFKCNSVSLLTITDVDFGSVLGVLVFAGIRRRRAGSLVVEAWYKRGKVILKSCYLVER